MGVQFADLGKHKNVYTVAFGFNDVHISSAVSNDGRALIMFNTATDELDSTKFANVPLDNLPFPECVLMFEDPHTIASLVQMLLEIQKSFFK